VLSLDLLRFRALMTREAISYCDLPAKLISEDDLQQSAELLSNHYGMWAGSNRRVKMPASKLREQMLFDTSTCSIAQAWVHEPDSGVRRKLVGHAFVCRFEIPEKVLYYSSTTAYDVRAPALSLDKHEIIVHLMMPFCSHCVRARYLGLRNL
jgi:hypothetical protein